MAFDKIQEYISTAAGTPGTLLIPKLIMPQLVAEQVKALIPRECAARVWGPSEIKGSSFSINLVTPSTGAVRVVGEGAGIPMDNLDFSSVTFTPVKYGISIRITREMMEDAQFNILDENIKMAGRRFAENENKLILAALDGAANTVAGGAAITIANLTSAILNLHNNDYQATDFIFGYEILQDLQNIDTFVEYQKVGNTEMLSKGFIGTIYGLNCVNFSTNAAPSTTYAKYGYVIDREKAYGIAIKRDLTVENFDLASYDMSGAAITQRIDVELLRSAAVSNITTA
jgi:HK97 family phage major capsid protein